MNLLANKNMFEKIQHVSFHNIISLKNDMKRNRFLATVAVLATQEHLTLSLLGSSSRTPTVHINQRPSKASRRVRTTLTDYATLGGEGGPAGSHALHRLGLPLRSAKHSLSRWRRKPCRPVSIPLSQHTPFLALPVRVAPPREKRRMQKLLLSLQCLIRVEYVKNGGKKYQDDKSCQIETLETFCKEQFTEYQCKQIANQANPKVSSLIHGVPPFLLHGIEQLRSFNVVRVGVTSSHTTKSLTGGVLSTCVPAWGC